MANSSSRKRNELTLKQRVEVIDYHKKNPLAGTRKLAEIFSCGRTQVQLILKKKDEIQAEFEANAPESRKRHRGTQFDEVNEVVYKWYTLARQRNVPVSGPMLQEEARYIAEKLGYGNFKASNGWLESFKSRHNLKQLTVSGEAADVAEETIEAWQERLKVLLKGYKAEDIWNEDETGCFYRALPEKTLSERKKECRGGKKSKERITVAFFANAAGGMELPVVIGKSTKPRCFKGIKDFKKPAGIPYYSNQKAWMNAEIMDSMLAALNRRLKMEKRNILLLMDNVSSHLPELKGKFSNIHVVFLPKNTTSKLQPLDAGIIKNFKVHYRRLLLRHTLAKVDESKLNASAIAKSIDILTAIRWIKQAWEKVESKTIKNCFRHCGVVEMEAEDESDPFADLQDDEQTSCESLQDLVSQFDPTMTSNDYLTADDDLSTCVTFENSDQWREELRSMVCEEDEKGCPSPKRSALDSDVEDDPEPESSSIKGFEEGLALSNELLRFLTENGMEEASGYMFKIICELEAAKLFKKTKQTNILQYFSTSE